MADRGNLDSAKRRISQLLDESIIAEKEEKVMEKPDENNKLNESPYHIKPWKVVDLSKLNIDKLREEFHEAPHKNIEIADLRSFISNKLQQMITHNSTRTSFALRLQVIIDRYNSGSSTIESYFDDLLDFVEKLREEELRSAREGLTESELEIFDLLKKENLTKEEEQKVKLAAKELLHTLKNSKPTLLITDWYKDTQTKVQVQTAIKQILDSALPESYDRAVYSTKCDLIFDHFLILAQGGS
jgi:type I restriction enzyme R subunit